jgi:glycosyltransferase involved in cell wall biosynthesis
MTLAILICTLPERFEKLKRLKNILEPQVERFKDRVFIKINDSGRQMPTGTKRNWLIEQTQSDYFVFVDDDDLVHAYYLDEIVKAMDSNPDVITFCGYITTNGANRVNWQIKLGNEYVEKNGMYYRWPNHLAVMKREKVRHIKFPDVWQLEDYRWSEQIAQRQLLKTEVHIPLELYHYDCNVKIPRVQRRQR